MKVLSKVISVVLTLIVITGVAYFSFIAYQSFYQEPPTYNTGNYITLSGEVTSVADTSFVIKMAEGEYNCFLDDKSLVVVNTDHPAANTVQSGHLDNPDVNALSLLQVGSNVYMTGVKDGSENDFVVRRLELLN